MALHEVDRQIFLLKMVKLFQRTSQILQIEPLLLFSFHSSFYTFTDDTSGIEIMGLHFSNAVKKGFISFVGKVLNMGIIKFWGFFFFQTRK